MRRRSGYTLIEMLVVISAASVVLTISAVLLHRTMHLASQARAFHAEEAVAWRLSSQLRTDAATAESLELETTQEEVVLTLQSEDDGPITYHFKGAQVERTQRHSELNEGRELFELPSIAGWKAESLDMNSTVRLTTNPRQRSPRSAPPVPLRLEIRAAGDFPS